MIRKSIMTVLLLLMAIVIAGCASEEAEEPIEKVTLGVEKSLLPAAVWVADKNGYFEAEGLALTIIEFDSGRASLSAMLDGEGVDISAAAPTPIMFNSFARDDYFIISTFAWAYEDIKIIANKDSGINNAEDLKGKTIGTLMGSTGQFFAETYLAHNSILPGDVEMVDVAPSELPEALQIGRIDAQVIWEPHGTNARELLGDKAIWLPSPHIYKTTFNFLTMKSFARENPEILKKFLRAIDKGTSFTQKNTRETQEIIANRLNIRKETVAFHWPEFTFQLALDQSLIINMEDEARWAINNNLTDATKVPNYLDYIYLDALEAVRPEAITVIR